MEWECNCYLYTALCFFVNQVEAGGGPGGNIGVGVLLLLVYGSVFSVIQVEAGGGQGENVGMGVYLLLVSDSVFCQPSGSRRVQEGM